MNNISEVANSQQPGESGAGQARFVRHIRIFLSSPGDVPAERRIALEVNTQLQYEPQFRGKVFLEPVAWDNPGAGTVMEATISPQESIDRELMQPADCDIVAVIFWMRMGTPLPNPPYCKPNGEPYYSGAEWKYENAIEAARRRKRDDDPPGQARPHVVVYRRKAGALPDPEAPDFQERVEQYGRVRKFFSLVNMYSLLVMGKLPERLIGTVRFALVYFASALTASLLTMCFVHKSLCAGASGAIFGIAGAFFVVGLHHKEPIPPQMMRLCGRSALPFFVYNLLFGLVVPHINLAAHWGGALGGAATAYGLEPHQDSRWARRLAATGAVVITFAAFFCHFIFLVVLGLRRAAIH